MAEAFVKTMKRDYVRVSPLPDARTVMETLPLWIEHYNSLHPHKALGYRPPASSSRIKPNPDRVRSFGGNNRRREQEPSTPSIENTFAKLKALLRKAAARTIDELWSVVAECLSAFTADECRNFFEAAGYDPD